MHDLSICSVENEFMSWIKTFCIQCVCVCAQLSQMPASSKSREALYICKDQIHEKPQQTMK